MPLKIAIALLSLVFCVALPAPEARALTVAQEMELGRNFMEQVRSQYHFVGDPAIAGYVASVGARIMQELPLQPFPYHFYVLDQPVYNAFAGPAGHIFINTGLLGAMDSEDEMAGILAHEMAHVSCRHISEKIERGKKNTTRLAGGHACGGLSGNRSCGQRHDYGLGGGGFHRVPGLQPRR